MASTFPVDGPPQARPAPHPLAGPQRVAAPWLAWGTTAPQQCDGDCWVGTLLGHRCGTHRSQRAPQITTPPLHLDWWGLRGLL